MSGELTDGEILEALAKVKAELLEAVDARLDRMAEAMGRTEALLGDMGAFEARLRKSEGGPEPMTRRLGPALCLGDPAYR